VNGKACSLIELSAKSGGFVTDSMHAGFFAINVKPEHREAFVEASIVEAKGVTTQEPGVYQFQVLVDGNRTTTNVNGSPWKTKSR
jgi:quinol monooxygenase YgiN